MKKLITLLLISGIAYGQTTIQFSPPVVAASGWNLTGNTLANNTSFLGAIDNRSLLFKTNNLQRFKIDSLGYCKITNTVIEKGTFEVVSVGNTSVSIGGVFGGGVGAIWTSQVPTKTDNNFQLAGTGNSIVILNAPVDSGVVTLVGGNSQAFANFYGNKAHSVNPFISFGDNSNSHLRLGATFNQPAIWWHNYITEWLTGAIATQWNFYMQGSTMKATGASTLTDYYAQWNAIGIAGTNMTIKNNWGYGTAGSAHITQSVVIGTNAHTPLANVDVTGNILATTSILSTGKTQGIGYGTGAGGTVTQATSRTTGVTLNDVSGAITLVSSAGLATYQTFQVTSSAVAATDVILVNQKSGTDLYIIHVTNVAAGSFKISYATTGGVTVEQPVFSYAVIKAVTN